MNRWEYQVLFCLWFCLYFCEKSDEFPASRKSLTNFLTPNHIFHRRRLNLQGFSSKEDSVDITSRHHQHITNLLHFFEEWQNEYLLELHQFRKSKTCNKIEEACNIGDVVLIHEVIHHELIFIPSWDAIRGNADVRYITNGKTSENRIPINKL